jgi:hypothetical protein
MTQEGNSPAVGGIPREPRVKTPAKIVAIDCCLRMGVSEIKVYSMGIPGS